MSQSAVPNESEDQTKSSLNIKTESEQEKAITCSLVPEKEEPHGFIKLAAEIFELLDRQLLCSKNRSIKRLFETKSERSRNRYFNINFERFG